MRKVLQLFLLFVFPLSAGEAIKLAHNLPENPKLELVQQALRIKKIDLIYDDLKNDTETSYFVFWNRPSWVKRKMLRKLPKEKSILFLWEAPLADKNLYSRKYLRHFKKIYTWNDDLVDYRRFFKFYIPALKPLELSLPSYAERKTLTAVFSSKTSKHPDNLYGKREEAVLFFDSRPGFEFYGRCWEGKKLKSYQGEAPSTIGVLKNYRFALCYENMQGLKGYITEKIFDCFAAGTVPIYWGAENIEKYIPEGCYIDRRLFDSNEKLSAFIESLDETAYTTYLDNIQKFLQSEAAQRFSQKMFSTIFLEAVHFP